MKVLIILLVLILNSLSVVLVTSLSSITPPSLVIRVCDGPSCSSKGSDELYNLFCKKQEEYKTMNENEEELFSISTIKCVNACKRSCNVAIVPKGRATGIKMNDMNDIELTKPAYSRVSSEKQVDRIINSVVSFIKNYNGEGY